MLEEEFSSAEAQMKDVLAKIRARFTHPGDKGTMAEDSFRAFLREYLPRRLAVGHGEVIDLTGNRSKQTDVVIANEDHPFTFTEDLPGLFFIEGVIGAGEVKTVLTSEHLESAIQNSREFKKLKYGHSRGATAVTNKSDLGRYYNCPPWFLFAYESSLSLSTICDHLSQASQAASGTAMDLVDAIFVLGTGSVINFGDGKGAFQFRNPEGISLPGWHWKSQDMTLIDLMAWLSTVMPRILRYESILARYLFRDNKSAS